MTLSVYTTLSHNPVEPDSFKICWQDLLAIYLVGLVMKFTLLGNEEEADEKSSFSWMWNDALKSLVGESVTRKKQRQATYVLYLSCSADFTSLPKPGKFGPFRLPFSSHRLATPLK